MSITVGYVNMLAFATGVIFGMSVMAIVSRWYIATHADVSERMARSIDRFNESIGKMRSFVDNGQGKVWHEEHEEQDDEDEIRTGPARA